MESDKEKYRQIRNLIILAGIIALFLINRKAMFAYLGHVWQVLSPVTIGAVLAFLLNIPLNFLEKKCFAFWNGTGRASKTLKRVLSILLSIAFLVLVIGFVVRMLVPRIREFIHILWDQIPALIQKVQELLGNFPDLQGQIMDALFGWYNTEGNVQDLFSNVTSMFGNMFGNLVNYVLGLIFAIYMLIEKESLKRQLHKVFLVCFPSEGGRMAEYILRKLYHNFVRFITGQCLEAVILGSLLCIVFTIMRIKYAALISIVIAITSLVPILGAFVGGFLGALLVLSVDFMQAVWFLVAFLIVQQVEGNLIYPHVVGGSVGLAPIWVLIAVTVGGGLFGIMGVLCAIPVLATIFGLFKDENCINFVKNMKNRA